MKTMVLTMKILVFAVIVVLTTAPTIHAQKKRVLIFSKTAGFHHHSIPAGIEAIKKLGSAGNFIADTTTNGVNFNLRNLKRYAAVIFLNTTGDVLDNTQQVAFENYIRSGGGFVGVHSATDCEYNWEWYGNLVGAYFGSHPAPQEAILTVMDASHISTRNLPEKWKRKDEWYNFKWIYGDLHLLITLDEGSYTGGTNGLNHPIAWYHEYDGGRAFYTGLGHTDESYSEPLFLQHLLGGIKYAMGEK